MNLTCKVSLIGLILSLGCGRTTDAEQAALRRCGDGAREYATFLQQQAWERLVAVTYRPLVDRQGGPARAVEGLSVDSAKLKFRVDKAEVDDPEQLIHAGRDLFAVVPVRMELRVSGKRLAGTSFFVGVSGDRGATWSFLDGYGLGPQGIRDVLPHFPPKISLPSRAFTQRK